MRLWPFQYGGKAVHLEEDQYGRIMVIDYGGQRVLCFDSRFEQSCMQLDHPYRLVHQYTQCMLMTLAFIEPVRVSLLGLGGGSLLRTLHHVLPECSFHVVELREKVVDIAREYFCLPDDNRVKFTISDATREVETLADNSTDILLSDLYDANQMIPAQVTEDFLRDTCRLLTRDGWLVINLHDLPCNEEAFFELLRSFFPTIILCNADENIVVMLSKSHPDNLHFSFRKIKTLEKLLRQPLAPLIPELKPVDFRFAR